MVRTNNLIGHGLLMKKRPYLLPCWRWSPTPSGKLVMVSRQASLALKELQKLLPGTTLKANPNIDSNVKNWKEKYALLVDIINLSRFHWNHENSSIEVDSVSVWEDYEMKNPKVKGMNGKPFPMFKSWKVLFGKDRATGEGAEDVVEVDTPVAEPDTPNLFDDLFTGCYNPVYENGDPIFDSGPSFVNLSTPLASGLPTIPTSQGNTSMSNAVPNRPKKKAKVNDKEASIHEALERFLTESNLQLEKIADAVGYEDRLYAKRREVFEELMKLDLELDDMFDATTVIVEAEERVDTFYSIPPQFKQRWVERVLEGKIYKKIT